MKQRHDRIELRVAQIEQYFFHVEGRPYAYALLAFPGEVKTASEPEAIGLAVYYFTFASWAGRPGLYVSAHGPLSLLIAN